jgi:hypothetical protein
MGKGSGIELDSSGHVARRDNREHENVSQPRLWIQSLTGIFKG